MPTNIIRSVYHLDQSVVGSVINISPDRRTKPRVTCDYSIIIEGFDGDGYNLNESARLANLSASGLYMKAHRIIECGSTLSVTVLLTSALAEHDTPKIAINGIVVRTEQQTDGTCGIAIKFNSYRFL